MPWCRSSTSMGKRRWQPIAGLENDLFGQDRSFRLRSLVNARNPAMGGTGLCGERI